MNIQDVMDLLSEADREKLMLCFNNEQSGVVEYFKDKFIGVNIETTTHKVVIRVGAWSLLEKV